jgi:hypothetical protein
MGADIGTSKDENRRFLFRLWSRDRQGWRRGHQDGLVRCDFAVRKQKEGSRLAFQGQAEGGRGGGGLERPEPGPSRARDPEA